MLKEVGEAGAARLLVLGTHLVVHVYRHQGDGVILHQDHGEAVVEAVRFVGDLG